jgi:hypothetical protein
MVIRQCKHKPVAREIYFPEIDKVLKLLLVGSVISSSQTRDTLISFKIVG